MIVRRDYAVSLRQRRLGIARTTYIKEIVMKFVSTAALALALAFGIGSSCAAATAKPLTPQQQKMKDCAAKWGDYKKEKNVKGRAEYRKFMSGCLKG